jgi:acylphosphatase
MVPIRRHLLISGRVQGVCFRHYTRQTALKNGVTGWVRNLPDGRVEALIEGEAQAVAATVDWCRNGPDMARVEEIKVEKLEASEKFESFRIR